MKTSANISAVGQYDAEAEYVALGSATQEAIWLYQLLNDLKIDTKGSIEIMEDNQSTIAMVKSSVVHKRTKHIDIKHHFIRETVQTRKITLVESATVVCFWLNQLIVPPDIVNTLPVVECLSSISFVHHQVYTVISILLFLLGT